MIVNRTIWLNPVEPHPLSFRAPMGMETKLNIAFIGQNGAPYSSDTAAQLQLTGRTSARTNTYFVPATDIVNGRARAVIPGDGLNDPHGYRLRLVGTLAGEPALLAVGSVTPVASAGLEAIPEDIIDTIDLTFNYNNPVDLGIAVWQDSSKGDEYDLTSQSTTISAAVYDSKGGSMLQPFTVTPVDANQVLLSLTVEQVNSLPPSCWWTMAASTSAGATTLCEGTVTISGVVAPGLVETIALYDYQKPDDLNPVGGQIIHANFTRNILKVALLTSGMEDISATLALVKPGCSITIDVVTWTVTAASAVPGWYEFTVTPIDQAAVDGVTSVTFSPAVT